MRHFKYLYAHTNLFFINGYVCVRACIYTCVMIYMLEDKTTKSKKKIFIKENL